MSDIHQGNPGLPRGDGAPPNPAAVWLADTFAGLTPKRLGIFGLAAFAIALCKPGSVVALQSGSGFAEATVGVLKSYVFTLLALAPVLLAVVATANRGPAAGRARIAWLIVAVVAGSIAGHAMLAVVVPVLTPDGFLVRFVGPDNAPHVQLLRRAGLLLTNMGICVAVVAFWYFLKREMDTTAALSREQQRREDIARESAEARLSVLQAQIEPHFLFNSLASIRRLYETEHDAGRAMLQHLTRYLTASLPILRAAQSTLGRELAMTVAYLNVQKFRMGPRLAVEVAVPERLHAIPMPPMMLPTLVENAIIHGLGPMPAGGRVRIGARLQPGKLTIEVADNGRGLQDTWGVGVGLANIRARLHSEFGDAAGLQLVGGTNGGVTAIIELPVPTAAREHAA
ncbi:MAG: histidine kinase [Burkholderiales bacterium]